MEYYFVYETKNIINGKSYIGVHKTQDLEDGYLGSGSALRKAIKKYGRNNFTRTILYQCASLEEAFTKEAEIVTENFVKDQSNYNLTTGGKTPGSKVLREAGKKGGDKNVKENKGWFSEESKRKRLEYANSKECKSHLKEIHPHAVEASRSKEAQEKRLRAWRESGAAKPERNSQFGTMWITDGLNNKRINVACEIPEGWRKGKVQDNSSRCGSFWVTDGKKNMLLNFGDEIPKDWRKGRSAWR